MCVSCERRGIILLEANPMSGVFRNIEPPPPHRPATLANGGRGWGGSIVLEDARHCSVLYICKYFVVVSIRIGGGRGGFPVGGERGFNRWYST